MSDAEFGAGQSSPRARRFEIVDETAMPAELDAEIRRFLCACFPPDEPVFSKTRHWHGTAPTFSVVHHDQNSLRGHVGIVVRVVRCGAAQVPIAGVQSLCVGAPARGTGLGAALLAEAMAEAARRGVRFGLLFCDRTLAPFYASRGWVFVAESVIARDEQGNPVPLPAKNLCMMSALSGDALPRGGIDLQGADW